MKIFSVTDPEFKPYGRVVTGLDTAKAEILAALANTPLPAATDYVAEDAALQELPAAVEVSEHLFGGMPCQLGWCNGHNTYLNCLEYHRDSEFNLGTEDFVLLLARQEEIAAASWTPPRSRRSASRQAHWWKSTPRRCITHPAMWTQPRASACWSPCPKAPIPQSPPSRMTAAMTRSCGPATSGCSPIPTAPRPRPGRMSDWWGRISTFDSCRAVGAGHVRPCTYKPQPIHGQQTQCCGAGMPAPYRASHKRRKPP